MNFAIGVDHEEVGVAVTELVIELGGRQRHVVEIIAGVLFVITKDGVESNPPNEWLHTGKEVLCPVAIVGSGADEVAGMQ